MLLSSLFEENDKPKKVKEGLKMGDYGHEKEKAAIAAQPKAHVSKIDMTGKVCKNCHKGRYQETGFHDDMDGVLHCPKCGAGTKRWVERKVKEDYDPEEADTVRAATKNIDTLSHTKKYWKDAARNLHDISIWDKAREKANKKAVTGMDEGETGPKFTGYWKAKDKAPPGKKMVGAAESEEAPTVEPTANPTDKITMDIPLFIRMMEYAREDAKDDMDLHSITDRAIQLMKEHEYLCMDNYDTLVGGQSVDEAIPVTKPNNIYDRAKNVIAAYNDEVKAQNPKFQKIDTRMFPLGILHTKSGVWTRGDGSRYQDWDRVMPWMKKQAEYLPGFWPWLEQQPGARKLNLSGEFSSSGFDAAIIYNNVVWVSRSGGKVIEFGSKGRLKNTNVWRKKATEDKIKGADGKACWDGYRYNGTKNGKDSCVKVKK